MDKLIPQAANHAELAEVMTAVHVLADKIDRPFLHRAGDTGLTVPEIIKDGLPIRCPGSRPVGHMILRQLDQQTFQEIECRENRSSGIRSLRQGWGFCGSLLPSIPRLVAQGLLRRSAAGRDTFGIGDFTQRHACVRIIHGGSPMMREFLSSYPLRGLESAPFAGRFSGPRDARF